MDSTDIIGLAPINLQEQSISASISSEISSLSTHELPADSAQDVAVLDASLKHLDFHDTDRLSEINTTPNDLQESALSASTDLKSYKITQALHEESFGNSAVETPQGRLYPSQQSSDDEEGTEFQEAISHSSRGALEIVEGICIPTRQMALITEADCHEKNCKMIEAEIEENSLGIGVSLAHPADKDVDDEPADPDDEDIQPGRLRRRRCYSEEKADSDRYEQDDEVLGDDDFEDEEEEGDNCDSYYSDAAEDGDENSLEAETPAAVSDDSNVSLVYRESGDGQEACDHMPPRATVIVAKREATGIPDEDEEEADELGRKLDADEDVKNPAYVPRTGRYYMHDQRFDAEDDENGDGEGEIKEDGDTAQEDTSSKQNKRRERRTGPAAERWSHDLFNERAQAPRSLQELIRRYGKNILPPELLTSPSGPNRESSSVTRRSTRAHVVRGGRRGHTSLFPHDSKMRRLNTGNLSKRGEEMQRKVDIEETEQNDTVPCIDNTNAEDVRVSSPSPNVDSCSLNPIIADSVTSCEDSSSLVPTADSSIPQISPSISKVALKSENQVGSCLAKHRTSRRRPIDEKILPPSRHSGFYTRQRFSGRPRAVLDSDSQQRQSRPCIVDARQILSLRENRNNQPEPLGTTDEEGQTNSLTSHSLASSTLVASNHNRLRRLPTSRVTSNQPPSGGIGRISIANNHSYDEDDSCEEGYEYNRREALDMRNGSRIRSSFPGSKDDYILNRPRPRQLIQPTSYQARRGQPLPSGTSVRGGYLAWRTRQQQQQQQPQWKGQSRKECEESGYDGDDYEGHNKKLMAAEPAEKSSQKQQINEHSSDESEDEEEEMKETLGKRQVYLSKNKSGGPGLLRVTRRLDNQQIRQQHYPNNLGAGVGMARRHTPTESSGSNEPHSGPPGRRRGPAFGRPLDDDAGNSRSGFDMRTGLASRRSGRLTTVTNINRRLGPPMPGSFQTESSQSRVGRRDDLTTPESIGGYRRSSQQHHLSSTTTIQGSAGPPVTEGPKRYLAAKKPTYQSTGSVAASTSGPVVDEQLVNGGILNTTESPVLSYGELSEAPTPTSTMLTSVPQVPLAGHLYPIQTQAPPPPINIPTVSTAGQLIFPSGLPEACPTALSQQHQQHSAAAFAAAMAAANYYSQPTAANSVGPMATGAMPHSQPPQQQQLMAAAQFASFLHHQQQQQQQSSHTQIAYDSLLQAMARSGHVPLGSSPLQAATATSISPGFYASPAAAVLAAAQAAATHAAYYGSNPAVQTTNQVPSSGQQGQPISHSATPAHLYLIAQPAPTPPMPLSTSYTPLSGATQEPRPLLGRRPGKALEMKDPREVAASKLKELSLPETSSLVAPSSRSETPTGISTTSASLNVEETFSVKLDQ